MLGCLGTYDIRKTGQMFPYFLLPVSFLKNPRMVLVA